jgi:hypothetical protein
MGIPCQWGYWIAALVKGAILRRAIYLGLNPENLAKGFVSLDPVAVRRVRAVRRATPRLTGLPPSRAGCAALGGGDEDLRVATGEANWPQQLDLRPM